MVSCASVPRSRVVLKWEYSEMKTTGLARNSVLFVLLATGLVVTVIVIILSTGRSDKVRLPDNGAMAMHVRELIAAQVAEAERLAGEGQHLHAAQILINAAGAQRAFEPSSSDSRSTGVAMVIERMALQQLSLVGKDQAYRELLRSLYPEWSNAKPPSSRLFHE